MDIDELVRSNPEQALKIVCRKNCKDIANTAAKYGNFTIINYFRDNVRSWGYAYKNSMVDAAENGQLEMVRYLFRLKGSETDGVLEASIRFGDVNITRSMIEEGIPHSGDLLRACFDKENIPMLEFVSTLPMKYKDDSGIILEAAKKDAYKSMIWLYDHGFPIKSKRTFIELARKGDIKMIEWAYERKFLYDERVLEAATNPNNFKKEIVQWFLDHKFPYYSHTAKRLRTLGFSL